MGAYPQEEKEAGNPALILKSITMAIKDNTRNGVQCENADNEILRRQVQRLDDKFTEFNTRFNDWAENQPMQQPMLPPSPEPVNQGPMDIRLPPDIAKSEDIRILAKAVCELNRSSAGTIEVVTKLRESNEAKQTHDAAATANLIEATVERCGRAFLDKADERLKTGLNSAFVRGQSYATGITYEDAATIGQRLGRIEDSIALGDRTRKLKKAIRILSITVAALITGLGFVGYDDYNVRQERNELARVEWLYRNLRSCLKESSQWLIADEKKMIYGSDEQRDSMKTEIFNREMTGPQFHYFKPHDRWTPPPKKKEQQKKEQPEEKDDSGSWYDFLFEPTENEKAALEAVRNNPNIPEGAKP